MSRPSKLYPPEPARKPVMFEQHNDERVDEYAWLQKPEESEVQEYLKAENRYADALMRPTKTLQKKLYKEIRGRIRENDMSVPLKDGPYYYYSRVQKGRQYAIHCRKLGEKGKEEIILDENVLAKEVAYFSLGACDMSPDHTLLAYSTDTTGNEHYTLYIKDLRTGSLLEERIDAVSDVAWAEDGLTMFYTREEHPHPPRQVLRHRVGENTALDVVVYEEKNLQWYVSIGKSRSREYIFVLSANYNSTEVRFIPAKQPHRAMTLIARRKRKVRYYVEHNGDYFYVMTNERAVNYKIMRTLSGGRLANKWEEWLPHNGKRAITGLVAFKSFIALTWRENGSEEIYLYGPERTGMDHVEMPETVHRVSLSGELEYESTFIRLTYESMVTPRTVFDYDIGDKKFIVRKQQKIPRYKKRLYVSSRVWAKNGNVRIPIILVHKKNVRQNGKAPLLLEAYGSYGICSDPHFSTARLSLLDRGFIVAVAHPRGGGEMGWKWHKDAYLKTKHRTTHDFIASAEYLIRNKYTSRARLAISGGSAGGMLMGQVLNIRPDLCEAALVYVPAADTLTSLLDETLGGTRLHYDEIGDPRKKDDYFYIKRHSPYQNVKKAAYPHMLVRSGMHDVRTPYWEAAKWIARLREYNMGVKSLLLKTEMMAGHFGKSGRYEWIKQKAFDYAFLLTALARK